MVFRVTAAAADFLERLAQELDVPASRYEEAESRYHSVGDWLSREESSLKEHSPDVYVQGSFRLGTPIRPVNDAEHYDIDLVCELSLGKHEVSQKGLKEKLGVEMKLYAERYGMKPADEGRRCWTLEYAEGAQFHLDALPAIPDGDSRRVVLESLQLSAEWAKSAIAITDTENDCYTKRTTAWPHSNPRGFKRAAAADSNGSASERRGRAYVSRENSPSASCSNLKAAPRYSFFGQGRGEADFRHHHYVGGESLREPARPARGTSQHFG